jgi:hypothetical protein
VDIADTVIVPLNGDALRFARSHGDFGKISVDVFSSCCKVSLLLDRRRGIEECLRIYG